jgi:hypothetical protein
MKKHADYVTSICMGDTLVEIRGHDGEVEYAYIGDEDVTEMLYSLNVWSHVEAIAKDER